MASIEPDAFLMDEPLSNLDAKLGVEMRAYVSMLHQQLGTTTVYVTHDQTEAMTMGDRVAVMRGGLLEQCDVPRRLYEHPVNASVKAEGRAEAQLPERELAGRKAAPGETTLRARLNPRTQAETGGPLRVSIDASRLHFFDVKSERSIW
jgi:multiple sugar transport system ATP-binding protein